MCIKIQKIQKKSVLTEEHEDGASILRDLKFLLRILKAAGLFPIFTQISPNEIEPPSKQNQLYSSLIRGIVYSLTIFNLYSMFQKGSTNVFGKSTGTESINQYIEILISITTYTGMLMVCSKHSRTYLRILSETLKVDYEIRQRYGARVRNRCEFSERTVVGIVCCQLFILGVKLSMDGTNISLQYLVLAFYALQNCTCSVFVILMASFLNIVKTRIEFVNMILNNYTYSMGGIRQRGPYVASFEEDVSFAFRLHNKLLQIYKLVNESCSLLVAFFMGYAFYTITTNTYNIFVEFTTKREVSVGLVLNCVAWLGLNSALLAMLTQSCGQTTKKANTTSQILARVYGKSRDYQNIIDKFLTKSIRQEVQFTAYGFFVVDNSTLFKIFSAVTTYLVILIQFKQLEDTKLDEHADLD